LAKVNSTDFNTTWVNVATALGYTPANKAGDSFTGAINLSTTGSHFNLYETDAADPQDRGLIEVNANNLNLYGVDNSASAFRLFLSGNITTGNVSTNGVWTFASGSEYLRITPGVESSLEGNGATGLTLNASNGAGTVRLRTAGAERMRIDASGNVGIGTSSPGYRLSVSGTAEITAAKEGVFTVTDGATVNLDPNNGSIQTWTLGANRTPDQANWAAGQSITLMVDDGTARTITWTTLGVVWETDGGTAPTLALTGFTVIVLWKVGTTIYGARVGDA
jgi:hypothetical protein